MKSKITKYLGIVIIALIIELLLTPIRKFDYRLSALIGLLCYGVLTYFITKKSEWGLKPCMIIAMIIIGLLPTKIYLMITILPEAAFLPLLTIIMYIIGISAGYGIYKSNKKVTTILAIVIITIILSLVYYFVVYDIWWGIYQNMMEAKGLFIKG